MVAIINDPPKLEESGCIGDVLIRRIDAERIILFDDVPVYFTPTEFRLILLLLTGHMVTDQKLIATVIDPWTRENLDKHIDNMRGKLRQANLPITITRVRKYGYALVVPT